MVSLLGVLLAIVAACCLAGQALTIRLATQNGRPTDVLLVVMGVNIAVLVPLTAIVDPNPTVTTKSVAAFAAAGIAGTMIGRILFYEGIKQIGASRAEPIKASMPLHATILAVFVLDEVVTLGQFVGIFLIVIGIVLVSWTERDTDADASSSVAVGVSLPLAAAIFFALEPIFATIGLAEGTSTFAGLTIKTVVAFVVFLGYLRWKNDVIRIREIPQHEIRWYVMAGVMSTGFLLAYYAGLAVSRVGVVVPIMQTSPLIVILVSAAALRGIERVTWKLVVAGMIVVTGAIVVTVAG